MLLEELGSCSGSSSLPYCSLLDAGQAFSGTLTVSTILRPDSGISLGVNVRIQGYDLESGYLCGTMETDDAPMADISAEVIFWEGEIIDNKNSTFTSGKFKWEAGHGQQLAVERWALFKSFSSLELQVKRDGGKSLGLSHYPYIFMRCKEQYPVNVGSDCGLELNKDAFYYLSFNCHNGFIRGFYYDKGCREMRKITRRHLKLENTNNGRLGFSFASYELQ